MTDEDRNFIKSHIYKYFRQTANLNSYICSIYHPLIQLKLLANNLIGTTTTDLISKGNNNSFAYVKRVSKKQNKEVVYRVTVTSVDEH